MSDKKTKEKEKREEEYVLIKPIKTAQSEHPRQSLYKRGGSQIEKQEKWNVQVSYRKKEKT